MCRSFLRQRSCVFFLSSCSARGRLLLASCWGLLLYLFLQHLQFSAPFLAPVACPAPAVEQRCGVCCVFRAALGFHPCAMLPQAPAVLRGFPCHRSPFGVSASDTVCLAYCCAGGVGWATALPLCSQCFSSTGGLARVRWVLHPVTGSSHGGCDCSLCGSVVVPYGSPCL